MNFKTMATKLFTSTDGRKFKTQDAYLKHQSELYDSHIKRIKLDALQSSSPKYIEHCLGLIKELEELKIEADSFRYNMR